MTVGVCLLAALAVLSPSDGTIVETLKDAQKAYLDASRQDRFKKMDSSAEKVRLAAIGSVQKPVKLEWTGPTNAVYALALASDRGDRHVYAITNRTCVYLTNLELGAAYRWKVKTGEETSPASRFKTASQAPRLLRADGVGNFRDLGGWKTADGRRVRENKVFRSAGLRFSSKATGSIFRQKVRLGERRITEAGIRTLREEFHIRTDLELRNAQETAGMTDTVLGEGVRWKVVPFVAYDFIDDLSRGRMKFAEIFRIFLDESNYPVLFHCSGGRDRTGTLAFLLNGLLGVPEEDLCRDWEFSVFAGQGASFTSDLIERLCTYLQSMPGEDFGTKVAAYAKSCGITDDELSKFRQIMLE